MTMKQILNNDLEINYTQLNENLKDTLVFIHGNSQGHRTFNRQANSSILKNYRLIFLDLPGHGDSSKMDKYTLPMMAESVALFIESLNLKSYAIVGHSLGGHVAIHLLKYINPLGIFIFATPPLKKPFDPNAFLANENIGALFQANSTEEQIDLLLNDFNLHGNEKIQSAEDYAKTDPNFRATIFNTVATGEYDDEVELLNKFDGELSVLIPTKDTMINNKYIGNALRDKNSNVEFSFVTAGHAPHLEKADEFNASLLSFCQVAFEEKQKQKNNMLLNSSSSVSV